MSDSELTYIDSETGTYGNLENIYIIDTSELPDDSVTDNEMGKFGSKYGYTVKELEESARNDGFESGTEVEPDWATEIAQSYASLVEIMKHMADKLDIDGTCQLCEMSFRFHASNCPVDELNVALANGLIGMVK